MRKRVSYIQAVVHYEGMDIKKGGGIQGHASEKWERKNER